MNDAVTSMETDSTDQERVTGLSRRNLMSVFGAVAGATAALTLPGSPAAARRGVPGIAPLPEALAPIKPFLTYLPLDGLAFNAYETGKTTLYDGLSGFQLLNPPGRLGAPLFIPAGSVIYQISVAYQGQPILEVFRRQLTVPTPWQMPFQLTLAAGGGAKTQTVDLPTPIVVDAESTYSIQTFLTAGSSIYGVTVGYLPPTQSFVPFVGSPRILDTREPGGGGKLTHTEERTIALGFPGARGAVINLTVTDTEQGGFVAVNPANIVYPGNSSINWTATGQNIANGVITALDGSGQIKIRGGVGSTHVIIDRIGWLI